MQVYRKNKVQQNCICDDNSDKILPIYILKITQKGIVFIMENSFAFGLPV